MTNIELLTFATADELARAAAHAWMDEIEAVNRAGKMHCVALSGGRITQKFFSSAVEQGKARSISFANCHFFWADERCVPPTDPESNYHMANELLFAPLNISAEKIHRLRGEDAPATARQLAEAEIRRCVPAVSGVQPRLDLVLLGMGEDGHIASLFPNATADILNATTTFLVVENSPKPPPIRLSLSYTAIAAAGKVWALVSGTGKADAFQASLKPDGCTPLARVIRSHPVKIFSNISGLGP